jgi:hypothetical protein
VSASALSLTLTLIPCHFSFSLSIANYVSFLYCLARLQRHTLHHYPAWLGLGVCLGAVRRLPRHFVNDNLSYQIAPLCLSPSASPPLPLPLLISLSSSPSPHLPLLISLSSSASPSPTPSLPLCAVSFGNSITSLVPSPISHSLVCVPRPRHLPDSVPSRRGAGSIPFGCDLGCR